MARSQSAVSDLLDAFRAGEGVDLIREAVQLVLQELIETEATEVIGADRYERSYARVTDRNGHRRRLFATQAGDVEVRIPKLRRGSCAGLAADFRTGRQPGGPCRVGRRGGRVRPVGLVVSDRGYGRQDTSSQLRHRTAGDVASSD